MAEPNRRQLAKMAEVFAALSDPARLRILGCLRSGPRSVGEIQRLCRLKQANTSKHLRVLREVGVAAPRRQGNSVRYEIIDKRMFALCDLLCR